MGCHVPGLPSSSHKPIGSRPRASGPGVTLPSPPGRPPARPLGPASAARGAAARASPLEELQLGRTASRPQLGRSVPRPQLERLRLEELRLDVPQLGRSAPRPQLGRSAPRPQLGRTASRPQLGRTAPRPQLGRTAPRPQLGRTASRPQLERLRLEELRLGVPPLGRARIPLKKKRRMSECGSSLPGAESAARAMLAFSWRGGVLFRHGV